MRRDRRLATGVDERAGRPLGATLPAALLAALLAIGSSPVCLRAQVSTGLDRVEQLVDLGRTEEAREVLLAWWDGESTAAPREELQRGLWLRGRLTIDAAMARLDYQRLVVLYPGGPYTDRALLRLAQAAHALGDEAAARQHVAALVRDHPDSPARREAEAWLSGAGPALAPPPRAAAREGADGSAAGAGEGAVRAGSGAASDADGARPAAASSLEFSVQLGAFRDQDGASSVFEKARAAGFEARIVHVEGSPLFHVRVGSFALRHDAQRMLERLGREGILSAVVRDQRAEQLVRR
jgi:hypothetical protein